MAEEIKIPRSRLLARNNFRIALRACTIPSGTATNDLHLFRMPRGWRSDVLSGSTYKLDRST